VNLRVQRVDLDRFLKKGTLTVRSLPLASRNLHCPGCQTILSNEPAWRRLTGMMLQSRLQ
jgi:hypothetical protein